MAARTDGGSMLTPGASPPGAEAKVRVAGTRPCQVSATLCVLSDASEEA